MQAPHDILRRMNKLTPNTNQICEPWVSVDPLGEALHFLHMNGVMYTRSEFTAPWGLALPPFPNRLMFHVIMSGRCWLKVEGAEAQLLQPGDFALVPHGEGHELLSEPSVSAIKLFDLPRELVSERYEILRHGQGGAETSMICSTVRFDHPAAHQLLRLLPKFIYIESWRTPHWEWIQSTLRLMAAEARELQPGGETVITRLADILVIQAIRAWIAQDPVAQTGWLGALQDQQIGYAILLIQREPARPWTVALLADEVGMSRWEP
nr:cupin domain-containing protein [Candidatus Entotheonella palauensis]